MNHFCSGEIVKLTDDEVTLKLDNGNEVVLPRDGGGDVDELEVGDYTMVYMAPTEEPN